MISHEAGEVRALAREWFHAARGGQIGGGQFTSFISVWIAFNALYALRFDDRAGDKAQVQAFARWDRALACHNRFLTISDYPHSIAVIAEKGVYNYRMNQVIAITDPSDLGQVLGAVYQVRCNLFHGRKSAGVMRDHGLIEAGRLIIYRFVGDMVDDDAVWEGI